MTVQELIEELETMDPEIEVMIGYYRSVNDSVVTVCEIESLDEERILDNKVLLDDDDAEEDKIVLVLSRG